jgi:glucose-1-phosphate thymidylyltransferase
MRAIIPVAGAGKNLRPHTYTQPKSLIPVAGKPILGFIIDQLLEVGIDDFTFIIGYLGDKIKEYVEKEYPKIKSTYVVQNSREGLGHAISLTKKSIPVDSEILIILGDTIIDTDIKKFVDAPTSVIGVKRATDPRMFGVAEMDEKDNILKVVEKPTIPKSNMAIVGIYKIKEFGELLAVLEKNVKTGYKTTQEYTLTDGLQGLIEKGIHVKGLKVENWYDCGQKDVLMQINALLLKRNRPKLPENLPHFENTIIVEPVYIGKNTVIKNSIIGPNVSIGENTQISNSIVHDSIIGSFSKIREIVMYNSIIGSDSALKGSEQKLNLGDNTELDLS